MRSYLEDGYTIRQQPCLIEMVVGQNEYRGGTRICFWIEWFCFRKASDYSYTIIFWKCCVNHLLLYCCNLGISMTIMTCTVLRWGLTLMLIDLFLWRDPCHATIFFKKPFFFLLQLGDGGLWSGEQVWSRSSAYRLLDEYQAVPWGDLLLQTAESGKGDDMANIEQCICLCDAVGIQYLNLAFVSGCSFVFWYAACVFSWLYWASTFRELLFHIL